MARVVIGMSGGVDSSVAALLLKEQGYDVVGLFMRNWDSLVNNDIEGNPNLDNNICPQEQDYNDALEVCKELDIPLHRIDFIKEYWDNVFTYFLEELKKGRTPNPDLMCNKYIKFDAFIKEAKKLGADYIATGHYANTKDGHLYRAKDLNKDQSYFLAQLTSKQLENVLFPLGDIEKPEVRRLAEENNIATAKKKDSTGICFIGERNYQKFVQNYLKKNPGKIIDVDTKEVIGEHEGLMNYTIGQRKQVGIGGYKEKHFVVGKNVEKNELYVAFGEDPETLYSDECEIEMVNLINPTDITECTAKFRYRGEDFPVSLEYLENGNIKVSYPEKVKSVTPGQACVLYNGDECLGSGIIKEVRKNGVKLWYL
jgi:tRNA-specific 2-thiouridylase